MGERERERASARVAAIDVVLEWLLKRSAKSRSILWSATAAPREKGGTVDNFAQLLSEVTEAGAPSEPIDCGSQRVVCPLAFG